ncbi:MAG: hypothetical protein CML55_10720 [Rhodobacteraceae bacterium]|nr:hypothetical protein [Paracoccaceae bacterium]MBO29492.1 hypothetical protein [Paracoccaceae bacterium]
MLIREHEEAGTYSQVVYSDCESYRYSLTREWDTNARRVMFVMLNPSKADEIANDPTVERCERRARALGFGAFRVTNIFAWRDTDPRTMRAAAAPVGPANDDMLRDGALWADQIIAAWGAHGAHRDRGREALALLRSCGVPLFHLGLTKEGHPRHPLYIAYAQQPLRWHAD